MFLGRGVCENTEIFYFVAVHVLYHSVLHLGLGIFLLSNSIKSENPVTIFMKFRVVDLHGNLQVKLILVKNHFSTILETGIELCRFCQK